ncbi:MAG TPA: hypothetical protein VH678_18735 [Xanthobacteraceae bacterium]|jgi:hypothetical protein
MPAFLVSPFVKIALGALGAGMVIHWAAREVRRINDELERIRAKSPADPIDRRAFPTLRHDPRTGLWRVM